MASAFTQHDFKIYYVKNGERFALPYAFYESYPTFRWDIPFGFNQKSYLFEMRTVYPVLYSDGKTYTCAYYWSGEVYSTVPQHRLTLSMNSSVINGIPSRINTWLGACEIRITLYDENKNQLCSHDRITDGTIYDFQQGNSQGKKWGSTNDGYYFCYDETVNTLINKFKTKFTFRQSNDVDENQDLEYILQISKTPLFGQGKNRTSLVEINNLHFQDIETSVNALFQNEKDENKFQEESISSLHPNTLYFFRARCFDGYDYSDWSIVNAAKVINNTLPYARIISVEYPTTIDENGKTIITDRENGEMIVCIQIDDDDNDYASANLCFSMPVTEEEIEVNSNLNCLPNSSLQKLNYEEEIGTSLSKNRLIKSRIKENLICIPTNKKIYLTWQTSKQILNKTKTNIYLYLKAYDGINESENVAVFGPFEINNSGIGQEAQGVSVKPLQWWTHGKVKWGFYYPLLPTNIQKHIIVTSDIPKETNNSNSNEKTGGCAFNWFKYWQDWENGQDPNYYDNIVPVHKYGITRVTPDYNFTVTYYPKYPQSITNNYDNKNNVIETIYHYNEEDLRKQSIGQGNNFLLFCPECDKLSILRTIIIKEENSLSYVYNTTEQAFPKGKEFDGKPYKLGYKCTECGKIYPMSIKYQDDLNYTGKNFYKKPEYAYYKGYNLGNDYVKQQQMDKDLMITRKSVYDAMVAEYKQKNQSETTPYTYFQLKEDKEDLKINGQLYGLMPSDMIYNLNPRPDLESFFKLHIRIKDRKYQIPYIDGTKLNYDLKKDYMYGYEAQQGGQDLQGNVVPPVPGDENMILLAAQGLWNYNPNMTYLYDTPPLSSSKPREYIDVAFDAENKCVGYITKTIYEDLKEDQLEDNYNTESYKSRHITYVFNRLSVSFTIKFPLIIQRNVNDRYRVKINDEFIYEGSLLDQQTDFVRCDFPYDMTLEGSGSNKITYWDLNSYEGDINNYIDKIFGKAFETKNENGFKNSDLPYYRHHDGYMWLYFNNFYNYVNPENKTIFIEKHGIMDIKIKKFELMPCPYNCYKLLGLNIFTSYQSYNSYPGQLKQFLKSGMLEKNNSNKDIRYVNKNQYYYTERKVEYNLSSGSPSYDFMESPIDNVIEDEFGKISTVSSGQPMFTCYKDEVDKNGYHFKYTEEDFKKTGKIYVRKYHVETCNPLPNGTFGYRDWIVIPIDDFSLNEIKTQKENSSNSSSSSSESSNKINRYYKKKVLNFRGLCYTQKTIPVMVDGQTIYEEGYFDNNDNCVSHKKPDVQQGQPEPDYYFRQSYDKWMNKITAKTCVVFEYVDLFEAINKNKTDYDQGNSPFNHKCPISVYSGITLKDLINRYGVYVMGAYDLTSNQNKIENNGQPYLETFSSSYLELGSEGKVIEKWEDYQVLMENNWRPKLINGFFTVEQGSSKQFLLDFQKDENGNYKEDENGKLVPIKSSAISSLERFNKAWKDKISTIKDHILSQTTVQQFNPAFYNKFGLILKGGYEPANRLDNYFKIDEDNIYKQKYIPLNSKIVHFIYNENGDPFTDYRIKSKIERERYLISDKSFIETDDSYKRFPYIDYRLIGKYYFDSYNYFSGLPYYEHASYQKRPDITYDFDRPWRIGGLKIILNENQKKRTVSPGAYIDFMKDYSASNWNFNFLQTSWNTYNRIHWADIQDEEQYALLYAQEVMSDGLTPYPMFSVKTKSSIWIDTLNAWCIPYNQSMSDIIDTFQSGLEYEKYYKFYMYLVNKNSNTVSADNVNSIRFQISKEAISPAIITETNYDAWTKQITIKFRFDDFNGNKYDVIGIYYTVDESVTEIVHDGWNEINLGAVVGDLTNLNSNKYGDNEINNNFIVVHTIKISLDLLSGITQTSSLRIKIDSALHSDIDGLTFPLFTIKMWANEFLKPVEENIRQITGYETRWIWKESYDENTNTTSGSWNYVSENEAVTVMGKLQETQENINDVEKQFKKWYYNLATFQYPDLDCFENWIYFTNLWESFYYTYFFNAYLAYKGENYKKDYNDYVKKFLNSNKTSAYKNEAWLIKRNYIYEYNAFYNKYRLCILRQYYFYGENSTRFLNWFESRKSSKSFEEIRTKFIQSYKDKFQKYFNIQDEEIIQDQENSSDQENPSNTEKFNPPDEDIMEFIIENNLGDSFIQYYAENYAYKDTRFQERAYIMLKNYNINTSINNNVLFEQQNSDSEQNPLNYAYNDWLNNYGHLWRNDSDKYQAFLIYMSGNYYEIDINNNDSINEQFIAPPTIKNENNLNQFGKVIARKDFMKLQSPNGSNYGLYYQALNESYYEYQKRYNENVQMKNMLETDFRINLIKQGYFCNGFENNIPYKSNGDINTCYRWRVQTKPYEGNLESNTIYDENGDSVYGYQQRFNMYIRFQMDFYNEFDSQNGFPLRDILFNEEGKRIIASIEDVDNSARTTPFAETNQNSTVNVPQMTNLNQNLYSDTSYDAKAFQLFAEINLPKELLPGRISGDICPQAWIDVWDLDPQTNTKDDFKSTYYWRVASYNIVDRPILESPFILSFIKSSLKSNIQDYNINYSKHSVMFYLFFKSEDIKYGNLDYNFYQAYKKLINPSEQYEYQYFTQPFNYGLWTICFHGFEESSSIQSKQGNYILNSDESITFNNGVLQIPETVILQGDNYSVNDEYMISVLIKMHKEQSWYNNNVPSEVRGRKMFIGCSDGGIGAYNNEELKKESIIYSSNEETRPTITEGTINVYQWNRIDVICRMNEQTGEKEYTYRFNKTESTDNENTDYWSETAPNAFFMKCPNYYSSMEVAFFGYMDHAPNEYELQQSDYYVDKIMANVKHHEYNINDSCQWITNYNINHGFIEDENSKINTNEWINLDRLKRGEVQFVTDRPRQIEFPSSSESSSSSEINYNDAEVSFIKDNLGNFNTFWIPFSPLRYKPFVINLGTEYLLFSHKLNSTRYINGSSYYEYLITLSRGFTNNIFGQESICFPKYSYLMPSQIIENALSFENPCVIKLNNNTWRMYFNVLFYNENHFEKKIYKADTKDFDNWSDFEEIILTHNNNIIINSNTPFVNKISDNYYELYVSNKMELPNVPNYIDTIKCFVSVDGINFEFKESIYHYADGDYKAYSPCIVNLNDHKRKLFYTLQNRQGQVIVSLQGYKTIEDSSDSSSSSSEEWHWRENVYNSNASRLMLEKYYIPPQEGQEEPVANHCIPFDGGRFIGSHYSNACIIHDVHYGCPVLRMYYNTIDEPYLWNKKQLSKIKDRYETTIHTEYFEEYNWTNANLNSAYYYGIDSWKNWTSHEKEKSLMLSLAVPSQIMSDDNNITWMTPIQFNNIINHSESTENQGSNYYLENQTRNFNLPISKDNLYCIKYEWYKPNGYEDNNQYQNCYAVKIITEPINSIITCIAQARWIGFDNINNTEAIMKPETVDYNYDVNSYTASGYIFEHDLSSEYNTWMEENEDLYGQNDQDTALKFLIKNKYYPKYLWWSRKGPGIYRYIGYNIINKYNW